MLKNLYRSLLLVLTTAVAQGQETYLPFGSEEYQLLNRLETKSGILSNQLFLNTQPVSRKAMVDFLLEEKSNAFNAGFTNVDNYNINRALSISGEWMKPNGDGALNSTTSLLNTFYQKQPDFLHVNKNDFFLVVNPLLSFHTVFEKDKARSLLFNSTQGIEIRGRIKDRVGFYFSATNNYEEPVTYVQDWIAKFDAVPGAAGYTKTKNGYRYLQFRGYADVALIKDHVNLTVGYDRHFIGDGYRSLFLSDFAEGAAFARINTKIWKLNYQNLYLVLKPQSTLGGLPTEGNKYATAHYLSMNLTRWLNVGFFETVTFSRKGNYEFGYLNPIIFYRAIERGMGSPDKVSIGFNAKANILKHISLYTQLLINEFTTKELFAGDGYWANKWGVQLGARYYDAFTINNLDLQAEVNVVRPYTYQHYRSSEGNMIANNTHYNQTLAHPLGAGFAELMVSANYQPMPRLHINARGLYYKQGIDTGNVNNGSNILKSYETRSSEYGVSLFNGPDAICMLFSLNGAYEIRPRLYFDLGATYRNYKVAQNVLPEQNTLYFTAGFRLNLARKDYAQF